MTSPTLTEEERVRVRHHAGFVNVTEVSTFVLGAPASLETQFIIEGCMNRVKAQALPQLRRILGILDQIEDQGVCDLELLAVSRIGDIEVDPKEQAKLRRQYDYWVGAMCNLLGACRNPFDFRLAAAGGVNRAVQH